MKAAMIKKYGRPDVFFIDDVEEVYPKKHEVKIQVHATTVNPVDFKTRSGKIFFLSGWKFPKVLGSDFSGVITACGDGVSDFACGDEVFGFTNAVTEGGAYGEFLCIDAARIAKKPATLSFLEAGVTPLAALTAYQGLFYIGAMTTGMRVCITGATGGVGHFAVQLASAAECHVTGICHSHNADLAREFGCDEVLPYDQVTFQQMSQKFDLIFDAVGKFGYFTCKQNLNPNGTYVTTLPSITPMLFQLLRLSPNGQKARFFLANSNTTDLMLLNDFVDIGLLKPYIEHVFTIQDIAAVHTLNETQKVKGKIGVKVLGEFTISS